MDVDRSKIAAQPVIPRSAAGYDGACHRAALRADLMGYLAIAVTMGRQSAG
jgi:hypothetical protein